MVVILDTVLSENAQFMAEVAGELQALGVMYRVSHDLFPGSVRWKRSVSERSVTDEAQVCGGREWEGSGGGMLSFSISFCNMIIIKCVIIVILFVCLFVCLFVFGEEML